VHVALQDGVSSLLLLLLLLLVRNIVISITSYTLYSTQPQQINRPMKITECATSIDTRCPRCERDVLKIAVSTDGSAGGSAGEYSHKKAAARPLLALALGLSGTGTGGRGTGGQKSGRGRGGRRRAGEGSEQGKGKGSLDAQEEYGKVKELLGRWRVKAMAMTMARGEERDV
jgi:hypothetical protein